MIEKKNTSCTEKYQNHIPYSFAYKLLCIDDKLNKPVILYRGKNVIYKLNEAILEEIMSVKDEDKKKVTDHDYITGKYRGSTH